MLHHKKNLKTLPLSRTTEEGRAPQQTPSPEVEITTSLIYWVDHQKSLYIPKQVYTKAHCVHKFKTISVHNTKLVSEFLIIF